MKTIEVCEVWDNGEDGRAPGRVVARFDNETIAKQAFGNNSCYYSFTKTVYTIFESAQDYKENSEQAQRKRALAKLTPQEKKLLGLPLQ